MPKIILIVTLLTLAACEAGDGGAEAPDTQTAPDVVDTADVVEPLDAGGEPPGSDAIVYGPAPELLGGSERPAAVTVPADYDASRSWPLVLLLHGYTGSAFQVDPVFLQFGMRVDAFGFVLVLPEGTEDPAGDRFWNASDACCNFFGSTVDDVGYLLGLIEEARALMPIDRVFVAGYSNGAFMAHRLACEAADDIDGIATLSGVLPLDESLCVPSRPVSVLHVHGTADDDIAYAGGTYDERAGAHPGAEETVARWRAHDGCEGEPEVHEALDYDNGVFGSETTTYAWTECEGGARVDLWKLDGTTHAPGFNDDFRDDFLRHLLDSR